MSNWLVTYPGGMAGGGLGLALSVYQFLKNEYGDEVI